MAEEIAYKVSVDTGQGGKSLKDLKQDFKNAQSELSGLAAGTKEYIKALEKLGSIRDNIGDLNAEINAFNPEGKVKAFGNVIGGMASGFQAATGAAALFGGENKEIEKTLLKVQAVMAFTEGIKGVMGLKDAFVVLNNVIKMNPVGLIIAGIAALTGVLFALKDKVKFIGDAFEYLSKIVNGTIDAFKQLGDWLGITSNASDALAETQIANAKKTGDAVSDKYDREIARAKAAGENTIELEKKKQEAIIATLKLEALAIVQAAKARGEFTEEENTRFTELIALTQKASDEIVLINITANKQKSDDNKKLTADYKAELKQREADEKAHQAHLKEINDLWIQSNLDATRAAYDADLETKKVNKEQEATDLNAISAEYRDEDTINYTVNAEKVSGLTNEEYQSRLLLAQQSADATMTISNLVFDLRSKNMKKGSKEELAMAKKQFKVNKGLGIANAVISTAQGIANGLTAPYPQNIVLPILAGLTGAASIAKIASTQFNDGGGGGGSAPSIGGAGGGGVSAPVIAPPSQGSTQLNPDGTIKTPTPSKQPIVKAVVVETDITKSQDRVSSIEKSAVL